MAPNRSAKGLMEPDPYVPPFFSIHPKTKAGSFLRIALVVFFVLFFALSLLGGKGLLFIHFYRLYYLIYIVPAAVLIALILLSLYKRMKRPLFRILIPGVLGFLAISVLLTVSSLLSMSCSYAPVPKMQLNDAMGNIILMRECDTPEPVETQRTDENGNIVTEKSYHHIKDTLRFTAKVLNNATGAQIVPQGEIMLSASTTYTIKENWIDAQTLEFTVTGDSEGTGTGKITVSIAEDTVQSPETAEDAVLKNSFTNDLGNLTVGLYAENTTVSAMTTSIYDLTENDFTQTFYAYPLKMRYFAKISTLSEGNLIVCPGGKLNGIQLRRMEEENAVELTAAEGSTGVSGSITIYFDKKAPTNAELEEAAQSR